MTLGASCLRAVAAAAGAFAAAPAYAEESKRGFTFGVSYTGDMFANLDGGKETGARAFGLLELTAESGDNLFGISGANAFANVQYVHGKSLSDDLVGDAQVISNIEAPDAVRLFEAWMSIPIAEDGYVKAGLIDLNSEFDVQDVGALFLNSSHGIGPDISQTGLNGPSIFPNTSTAVMASFGQDGWTIRLGAFNAVSGDPDNPGQTVIRLPGDTGLLLVGEAELRLSENAEVQFGAWSYTSKFDAIDDPEEEKGSSGAYALVQGQLASVQGQPLDAWLRMGVASTAANPIGTYVGGGFAVGPEERRFGLAVSHARLGDTARRVAGPGGSERAETNIELTYAHVINDRLTIQPDVQYVINPGFDPELRNALVAGVRLQVRLY